MIEKSQDRINILKKIDEYEAKGWFSKDVEDDPPTIPLLPDDVDYLCEKFSSKIKNNSLFICFLEKIFFKKENKGKERKDCKKRINSKESHCNACWKTGTKSARRNTEVGHRA